MLVKSRAFVVLRLSFTTIKKNLEKKWCRANRRAKKSHINVGVKTLRTLLGALPYFRLVEQQLQEVGFGVGIISGFGLDLLWRRILHQRKANRVHELTRGF